MPLKVMHYCRLVVISSIDPCYLVIHNMNFVSRFPHSNPDLLKRWVLNIRRENFVPTKKSVVCSDHFEEEWFDRTGQTVRLRSGALPTKFKLPDHLVKVL